MFSLKCFKIIRKRFHDFTFLQNWNVLVLIYSCTFIHHHHYYCFLLLLFCLVPFFLFSCIYLLKFFIFQQSSTTVCKVCYDMTLSVIEYNKGNREICMILLFQSLFSTFIDSHWNLACCWIAHFLSEKQFVI